MRRLAEAALFCAPLGMNTLTLGLSYIDDVLGNEGGYSNNAADRGGETNWGITYFTSRKYGYKGLMRDMTRSQAVDIYMQLFWINRFDQLAEIGMPHLAYAALDFGVNSGNARPAEALQRVLNAINREEYRWKDLKVDGSIGPATMTALAMAQKAFAEEAELLLIFALNSIRFSFLLNLVEKSPTQEQFMLGWLRRCVKVAKQTEV